MFQLLLHPHNPVLPHPGAEGAGVEAEEYSRPVFPLDPPAGFFEHLKDVVMFEFHERFIVPANLFLSFFERIKTIQNLQRAPLADDYRPFNDALKLPNVAGPAVLLQGIQGVLCHGLDLFADFLIEFGDKMIDEQRDVIFSQP